MRIANKIVYDMVKTNLENATRELYQAQKVAASGKRITKLSDDPIGVTQVLDIKSSLAIIEQMGRNITMGTSWLTAAESALSSVQDLISESKALCVQMATATTGTEERAAAANTVQNTLEEIISLANTEVNGRYIFAGSETDSSPFDEDGTYSGNNDPFKIKIGRDTTVAVGCDGEAVFGTIFETLNDLKSALESDNISGIEVAMDDLDSHFERISSQISDIGSKITRMEIKERIYEDSELYNTERLSQIEDADITEAIIDLESKELAYQACLASSSKVMELSLLDYLE
jgi:flagellar hook-associated protein 3 FlgL